MKIGFLIADVNEFEPLKQRAQKIDTVYKMTRAQFNVKNNEVSALCCGVGKVNAALGATVLAMQGAQAIFSVGYSGGIAFVERGDTVVGTNFIEHDFDLTPLGYKRGQKPSEPLFYNADKKLNDIIFSVFPDIKKGVMVCGDCFVCDDLLKTELKLEYSATACDMETAAAAAVCYKFDIPFVAIRRISDDAGDNADVLYKKAKTKYEELLMDMALKVVENIG
ncbi:MAG: 5'-methylthioadenosine/S-adenosylhomocysteine nucleosidase [Acutalibacteraceae bacterium]|nr:5'-methylthioadenosine/S-adenosylhomocysteine nucleosidase [Acutalibacteraceae bacterium]